MRPPPLPSMLVVAFAWSQTHKQSQWSLCTAEAVSRFFEHVHNASSLKKIPIFVSIFLSPRRALPIWHNNKLKGEEATIECIRNVHTLSPSISLQVCSFYFYPSILRIECCDRCLMWNRSIKFRRFASLLAPAPRISLVLPFPWSVLLLARLHIWFTQQLALLFKPFCQFAWVVQKHRDQWRADRCGSFSVRFALFW